MLFRSDVVDELEGLHDDLGWAIVRLVEQRRAARGTPADPGAGRTAMPARDTAPAELVSVGNGDALIVVNSETVRSIPGVQMIPLSETEAFLALEPGKGMADLELAVQDHFESMRAKSKGKDALGRLLAQLRRWRRDSALTFHQRAIILVSGQTSIK